MPIPRHRISKSQKWLLFLAFMFYYIFVLNYQNPIDISYYEKVRKNQIKKEKKKGFNDIFNFTVNMNHLSAEPLVSFNIKLWFDREKV